METDSLTDGILIVVLVIGLAVIVVALMIASGAM